ncbi:ATP-binding protein [Streptomyces sp. NPDC056716]|uniref:ATP-binding protein n=1 Tax=unclassified Streptomyces TaxID=2593676 RepID=UPI00368F9AF8
MGFVCRQHRPPSLDLLRRLGDDQVRVAVTDRSKALPEPAFPSDDEAHGRGLAIIDAVSREWGVEPLNWGKRVWVDLEAPSVEDSAVDIHRHSSSPSPKATHLLTVLAVAAMLTAAVVVTSR